MLRAACLIRASACNVPGFFRRGMPNRPKRLSVKIQFIDISKDTRSILLKIRFHV